ncbi:uncharacterized protein METZ01_LOCUS377916, partial [marine metagenome]
MSAYRGQGGNQRNMGQQSGCDRWACSGFGGASACGHCVLGRGHQGDES